MSVEVVHEKYSALGEFPLIREECVFCSEDTRYWWREGCMPVCVVCAGKSSITEDVCVELAEKEGYGPL